MVYGPPRINSNSGEGRGQIDRLKREAEEHNANLAPEVLGMVRTTGPRRQCRHMVDDEGNETWVEI